MFADQELRLPKAFVCSRGVGYGELMNVMTVQKDREERFGRMPAFSMKLSRAFLSSPMERLISENNQKNDKLSPFD